MSTKHDRQTLIERVVESGRVATQGELRTALRKRRMTVDQSTLSRDLAELGVRKVGGRYVLQANTETRQARRDYASVVKGFVTCGPHLIVIATEVGQAQPVAVAIDEAHESSIAGTVAGDDTIFVATRNRGKQTVALRRLRKWFAAEGGR
jgi:transcriptional regulator of arginine metabolism